jgi:ABC-2 type transport system permease protein
LNDENGAIAEVLKNDFKLQTLPIDQKDQFIKNLSINKEGVLINKNDKSIELYAYKLNNDIKELKGFLDGYHKQVEMQKLGLTADQLSKVLSSAPIDESYVYTENSNKRLVLAFFFAGLMIVAVFLSFAYQFTAITGEKQLKITEQIVSAISPQVWMDGKIFGITLTGMSSMITNSLLITVGTVIFFQFTGTPISKVVDFLNLPLIVLYLPFAILGVLIWNAMLAAIASIITDPNNSGKSGLMMLPILFVMASFFVTHDPDNGFSVFLSWFPLTSATSMPMRWAITEVGVEQLIGSFTLLVITFYFLRKIAAKIFRVSILMTGKEPSWSDVYKFIKMQ